MFCETENSLQNILHIRSKYEKHSAYIVLSVPQDFVMDLNNVTRSPTETYYVTKVHASSFDVVVGVGSRELAWALPGEYGGRGTRHMAL